MATCIPEWWMMCDALRLWSCLNWILSLKTLISRYNLSVLSKWMKKVLSHRSITYCFGIQNCIKWAKSHFSSTVLPFWAYIWPYCLFVSCPTVILVGKPKSKHINKVTLAKMMLIKVPGMFSDSFFDPPEYHLTGCGELEMWRSSESCEPRKNSRVCR